MLLMNEKIKAREVELTGLDGEDLGIMSRDEALALAKANKADLVCTSLFKQADGPVKVKEFRLTVHIEDHDYETKLSQMQRLLETGKAVQPIIHIQGKEGDAARKLLERLIQDLAGKGTKETGIQMSGKQATVKLLPV